MPPRLSQFIAAQPAEEIARQFALLTQGAAVRAVMTALVYLTSAIYLPLWLVGCCAVIDYAADYSGLRWMKGLVPAERPTAYLGTLAAVIVSELAFCGVLAVIFQDPSPLARPFAVGTLTLTMLQLVSVRVIHLPYAAVGIITALVVALLAVTVHWQASGDLLGFVLTVLGLFAAAFFVFDVVRANHGLHVAMARDRAAAEAAGQAKSRFLAQMSHELRTPLNAILGLGHVELSQACSAESAERLGLIVKSARGLGVILDDILDMSAIEAGHLPIRPAPADPRAELNTVVALYRPLFEAEGLHLTLQLDENLPALVLLDAQRLRQCLSNLLSNALKHTAKGGATVLARMTTGHLLSIEVEDSGRGIAKVLADRMFEPFLRGAGDVPGSGLGLSISRTLARSMGGDLCLLPSASGARFWLTLATKAAEASADGPANRPATLPTRLADVRVLVVDDIATNRLVAMAYLRLAGVRAEEAAGGAEALEKITADPPDLVLLDMNMPDMDGLTTLRNIRSLGLGAKALPVIAMTADATEDHRRRYLEAGLDGYLAKPLTPEAVTEVLARHLGGNPDGRRMF